MFPATTTVVAVSAARSARHGPDLGPEGRPAEPAVVRGIEQDVGSRRPPRPAGGRGEQLEAEDGAGPDRRRRRLRRIRDRSVRAGNSVSGSWSAAPGVELGDHGDQVAHPPQRREELAERGVLPPGHEHVLVVPGELPGRDAGPAAGGGG